MEGIIMSKKPTQAFVFKNIYPKMRYMMSLGRKSYGLIMTIRNMFSRRSHDSSVIPDKYTVCNTSTINSDMDLDCMEGSMPTDIDGSLYLCQCLGTPEAFMVGDTNIIRLDFNKDTTHMTNRLLWTPAALARLKLKKTVHRFDYFGLMYLSPGLGMFSYTEGMYLMPDGRIAVTSDVDRPWVIDRETLRAETPIGRRDEWLPMMSGNPGEVMGDLFAGYSNSHVIYTDHEQGEVFLANYQYKQVDGEHPVKLIRWDGYHEFETWLVVDQQGNQIEIKQSIHELVFTRDYILLADTAFVAGTEMLTPWVNAPLPNEKTVVYNIDRKTLTPDTKTTVAIRVEVDEPCIHLIAEYENPNDLITVYMLHTPATNTAEILKSYDRDMNGKLFKENLVGYGTLPVLDLSSIAKHVIDVKSSKILKSDYIAEKPFCWGPYLYTYMGRQVKAFNKQDLFIMFKGFSKDVLPKRIYKAYKNVNNRRVPIDEMVDGLGIQHNNSICRVTTEDFKIADSYIFPDKVLLYTMSCLDSNKEDGKGYVIAGIVTDDIASNASSGHEYWLFNAGDLARGPICKLGHEHMNNSTIFHTVYIPDKIAKELNLKEKTYQVPLREDYKEEELKKWDPSVLESFNETIWPYFEASSTKDLDKIEKDVTRLAARRIPESYGKEDLIGEERLVDAPAFAERMISEVERLWQTTGWKEERDKGGVLVESKEVKGVFESSGVLVTRSLGDIQASAKATFDMLTSPEGYAVIDPVSKEEDHKKPPLEIYEWRDGCRLEAAVATTNIPVLPTSDFVVLNAIDAKARLFVSKSIIHEKVPGGSRYSKESPPENGRVRALNTFAIKIEEIDDNRCRVYGINYADMAGKTSAKMNNFVNTKAFFPPLYKRIKKAME